MFCSGSWVEINLLECANRLENHFLCLPITGIAFEVLKKQGILQLQKR